MAALPYMQLYIADYTADTTSVYRRAWRILATDVQLLANRSPDPQNRLSKIARLSNDRWDAVEPSLKEFLTITEPNGYRSV